MKRILVFILLSIFISSCGLFEESISNDSISENDIIKSDDKELDENSFEKKDEDINNNFSDNLKKHFKNTLETDESNEISDVEEFVLNFYSSILEKDCNILSNSFNNKIYVLNGGSFVDITNNISIDKREEFCNQTYRTTVNVGKKNPDPNKIYSIDDFTNVYGYDIYDSEYLNKNLISLNKNFKNVDLSLFGEGDFLFIASKKFDSQEFRFDGTYLILIVSKDSGNWKIKAVGGVR